MTLVVAKKCENSKLTKGVVARYVPPKQKLSSAVISRGEGVPYSNCVRSADKALHALISDRANLDHQCPTEKAIDRFLKSIAILKYDIELCVTE